MSKKSVLELYNKLVCFKSFFIGIWVLRRVIPNKKEWMPEKLEANYKGPYQMEEVTPRETYILKNAQGVMESMSQNAHHIRKYNF